MEHDLNVKRVVINTQKRPIYGILTEPLRGSLTINGANVESFDEYIPAAHV